MIFPNSFGEEAIRIHRETNHSYDENLPYEYHLSLAVKTGEQFKHLLRSDLGEDWHWVESVIWGHDLIEDARCSYNDILNMARNAPHYEEDARKIAEAIRAVTSDIRGRNRKERMPDYIYEEIRTTPGSTFAKLADRIANVKHGLISGSEKKENYKKENAHFKKMLYFEEYKEMWDYLEKLLNLNI